MDLRWIYYNSQGVRSEATLYTGNTMITQDALITNYEKDVLE